MERDRLAVVSAGFSRRSDPSGYIRCLRATHHDPADRGLAPSFEMLLHTAGKSFQGTDECLDHAANSNSVSGLASIIPDFLALNIPISQKFEWMSYVARIP